MVCPIKYPYISQKTREFGTQVISLNGDAIPISYELDL